MKMAPVQAGAAIGGELWWDDLVPLDLLQRWGDAEVRPMVVLGPNLELIWSNSAGEEALARGVDVVAKNGRFQLANAAEMPAFARLLATASGKTTAWCSAGGEGDALVFRVSRIEVAGQAATGVVFYSAGPRYAPHWADFSSVFGLTATEFKVARRLLDGLQVDAIAIELNIACGTARIHVRNLYGKLEVSSREAMFRLLLPFHIA
ncbi:MAG: helix-turn-helix transcriptional regulator [Pseudomonadota bacterium]